MEGDIDLESIVKMSDGFNGADLRNVITEAGLFAIKDYRDAINQDDLNKVRKVQNLAPISFGVPVDISGRERVSSL